MTPRAMGWWLGMACLASMGCKDDPPSPAAPAAPATSASPSAKTPSAVSATFPPSHAPKALWGPLKLGMPRATVKAALTKLGYEVQTLGPRELPRSNVKAKHAPWTMMAAFDDSGLRRFFVSGEVARAEAEAATKQLSTRFGRGRPIQQSRYRTWTSPAGEYELFVAGIQHGSTCDEKDCLSWSVNQRWKGGAGALDFAGLTWGMSADAVRTALAGEGLDAPLEGGRYEIRSDDERSGRVRLDDGGKLVGLELSETMPSRRQALAKRDALAKERGAPTTTSQSRSLRFERDGLRVTIRLGDGKGGKRTVSETYEAHPAGLKKSR